MHRTNFLHIFTAVRRKFSAVGTSQTTLEKNGDGDSQKLFRFGFNELDEAAARAYESAGFRVIFIKGLLTNALTSRDAGAGLDCMTSEIRTPVRWAKK